MARNIPQKFLVAFSFAGEQRDLVRSVAEAIEKILGESTVFYDEWFEHYIAGQDADTKLQEIYGERSMLVVVCVSEDYNNKPWTQTEHESIRALSMQVRSSQDKMERLRVLPLRVGDGNVSGIPSNAICPDIRQRAPELTAQLIVNRLRLIQPKTERAKLRPIYLAECTPDMEEQRSRVEAFLQDLGWSVLPDSDYPDAEYKNRLQEDLKNSLAFIQLLGPYPWKRGAFDRIQNEAAVELKLRRFRYRSSDLDLEKVDPAHREFLIEANIIEAGFEDFKLYLEKELKVLQHQIERPMSQVEVNGNPPLVRVVIRSLNPDPLWEKVFRWIYDQEKILAYQLRDDESLEEKHLAEPCQGFLVVADEAALDEGPHSARRDMEQCRQIQLKEKNAARRPPVGLVYWPPPTEPPWAKLLRSTPQKLYRVLGEEQPKLSDFFAEVRRVEQ
jgi:hypothetical protein